MYKKFYLKIFFIIPIYNQKKISILPKKENLLLIKTNTILLYNIQKDLLLHKFNKNQKIEWIYTQNNLNENLYFSKIIQVSYLIICLSLSRLYFWIHSNYNFFQKEIIKLMQIERHFLIFFFLLIMIIISHCKKITTGVYLNFSHMQSKYFNILSFFLVLSESIFFFIFYICFIILIRSRDLSNIIFAIDEVIKNEYIYISFFLCHLISGNIFYWISIIILIIHRYILYKLNSNSDYIKKNLEKIERCQFKTRNDQLFIPKSCQKFLLDLEISI
jgi:hypothetical protein